MTGGALPLFLLCAALGLALGFGSKRGAWFGFACMVGVAILLASLSLPERLAPPITAGLLLSVIVTAALSYVRSGSADRWLLAAGLNAGGWAGAYASAFDQRAALALALPLGLLFIPGRWFVERDYSIVLKVAASWMIAIASLSIFVSLLPTPGYKPDHME